MANHRKYTDEELAQAVEASVSYSEVLRKLGLKPGGGAQNYVGQRAHRLGFSTLHFTGRARNPKPSPGKRELTDLLVKGGPTIGTTALKRRLVAAGLLQYKCHDPRCSLSNEWNGTPLVLHLDHINGVNTDNRLENLRLLCPNCHSQTHTYSGKNHKPRLSKQVTQSFCACGAKTASRSNVCRSCRKTNGRVPSKAGSIAQLQRQGVAWPPNDELRTLVWQQSVLQIAKTIGVSDKAVQKHCLRHEIPTPPRGYWAKQRALK